MHSSVFKLGCISVDWTTELILSLNSLVHIALPNYQAIYGVHNSTYRMWVVRTHAVEIEWI